MRFLTGLTLCFLSVCMASCEKEISTEQFTGNTGSTEKVKTYTEKFSYGGQVIEEVYQMEYDAQGRVTGAIGTKNPGHKFVFAYLTAKKITMDLYNAGSVEIHVENYLNNSGIVDSTFQYNDTRDSMTEKYSYNIKGQLEKVFMYDYGLPQGSKLSDITTYTYDARGNMISETSSGKSLSYEYYSNLQAVMPVLIPMMMPMQGKKQDMMKKSSTSAGGSSASVDYTYTFDAKGRLILQKGAISVGGTIEKSFTYY